jgi:N-acetyl-gamma-glutamyl-phosphate reductase
LFPERLKGLDLVFLCTPNEISLEWAPKILAQGVSVIDLSGSFRLKKHDYLKWYGFDHTENELLKKSEYALYPWQKLASLKDKAGPRLIANPGCYATAVEMTLLPLLKAQVIHAQHIFVDAKSGTTGAGRKASAALLFSEVAGEFKPYKVGQHQHWPEIVETLEKFAGVVCEPVFVTELLPIERGISAAFFMEWDPAWPQEKRTAHELEKIFVEAYLSDASVKIGQGDEFAAIKSVARTNKISIKVNVAFDKPIAFCVIDNLQRGAAGQALMNAYQLFDKKIPEFLL